MPFTGDRSGRRVQTLLIASAYPRKVTPPPNCPRLHGVFLTNVVRCNPPGNRNPTPAEVANCTPYLQTELDSIRPKVVATLGTFAAAWAFKALLRQDLPAGIRTLHGQTWQTGDVTLLCLVHPARASNAQMKVAEEEFRRLLSR